MFPVLSNENYRREYEISTNNNTLGHDDCGQIYIGDPSGQSYNNTSGYGLFPNSNPYWVQTYPNTGTTGTITFSNQAEKYSVMDLPREDMPIKVFVCGRMLTLGMLGSDVEVAYTGDKLIFSPGVINVICYNDRTTISLEYKDEIYHYNYIGTDGSMVEADLLSTISK